MADEKLARERITEGLDQAGGGAPKKTNSAAAGIPAEGGEKIVRDAAGNVIGKADRAQVVRDKFGKVIGEVGPPEPEPGPSIADRITQGLIQGGIDAQNKIGSILELMTADARTARTITDKASQWDWKGQREAGKKKAELLAKFEKAAGEINLLRNDIGYEPGTAEFKKDLDRYIKNLRQHFNDEGPFHPNRF
jgi:hypothetical protein